MVDWMTWEQDLARYEIDYGSSVSEDVKCAIVAQCVPYKVKLNLRSCPSDLLEDYQKLKNFVKDLMDKGKAFCLDTGTFPMEIDAMRPWYQNQSFKSQAVGAQFGAFGNK